MNCEEKQENRHDVAPESEIRVEIEVSEKTAVAWVKRENEDLETGHFLDYKKIKDLLE